MHRSEQINELATALAKAQAEMEGASKERENPHFRSKYADLGAVWDAIREPLSKHGLSVTQWMRSAGGDGVHAVEVETLLLHASGQWISDTFAVPVSKVDAQGYGSAATYCRRYALMAAVGIAPVDDDANAAVGGSLPKKASAPPPKPQQAKPPARDAANPVDAATSAIERVAFDGAALLIDQIHNSTKITDPDAKDALLEKLATRILQVCGDGDPDPLLSKIAAFRKEHQHTFAGQ